MEAIDKAKHAILGLPEQLGIGRAKYNEVYYADQDGDNGKPTAFLPEEHRKYDAKCYFSKAGRRDEHPAEAMHDAKRGPDSMKAYSEFLTGMALINQQVEFRFWSSDLSEAARALVGCSQIQRQLLPGLVANQPSGAYLETPHGRAR